MPDRPAVLSARFCGVTTEFHCADPGDVDHLEYYLRDHLVAGAAPELSVLLESADGGSFIAALGTPTVKRAWWRTPGSPWQLYEEWQSRAERPSPVPPFGLAPLRDLVRIRHGAALAAPDGSLRTLAVTGASGAGKSVWLVQLLRAGWRFVSDDLLVLDRKAPGRLHYYGRPVGVRERSLPLLPWLDETVLADAPRIPTRWGDTWMVRPQRLGRCAEPGQLLTLAWRLDLARGDDFTVRTAGGTARVSWDPQRHLELLGAVCAELTGLRS
ncbi:hypothetical protein [Kitasatospora sp. McL0602]|uniref:hypothetical protein n=1 Tax=Kitasatospora sp. McL0602 TaxID=3439530 RepID=UPI003F8BEA65